METGEFIKNIEGTDSMSVLYLLSWYNKLNKNDYIIQLGDGFVSINYLQNNDIYFKIEIGKYLHIFYAGLIYSINDKDYLCTLMEQGMVSIINLYDKQTIKNIYLRSSSLKYIIEWNNKYLIIADDENKSIKIFDLNLFVVISDIKIKNVDSVKCIKKIYHPINGKSLLTASDEGVIKLWII